MMLNFQMAQFNCDIIFFEIFAHKKLIAATLGGADEVQIERKQISFHAKKTAQKIPAEAGIIGAA